MHAIRIFLAAAFVGGFSGAAFAADVYASRLTSVAYDGAMRANVQGDGHVSATLNGSSLTVTGDFTALPSAASSVKLYSGPGIGVPGDALLDLQLSGQNQGSISGTVKLSGKQLAALKQGHVYVQLNSQKAPDGNLWGWLLPEHVFPGANVPEKGHGFLPQLDVPGNWAEKR
ncbi:MAG TPA: CHRD domain-containing protein [Rhizomicrobium sp.]|nr:CHRD domain-containing protein [Rhizomicrobium sp.]